MKLNKISLKWKLFGYILIFGVVVIAVFCIFQILLLDRVYRGTKIKQTKNIMSEVYSLVDQSSPDDLKDSNSSLSKNLVQIVKNKETDVFIIKKEQIPPVSSQDVPTVKYDLIYPSTDITEFSSKVKINLIDTFNQITMVNNPMFVVVDDTNHEYFHQQVSEDEKIVKEEDITYCTRVELKDKSDAYMLIIYSRITPVEPAIATLKTQLLYITLIVIVLSIIIALILSRKISKPLIEMTDEAKKLAEKEYDLTFKGEGFLEISELNDTLNYAVQELKKTETLQHELIANVSHDLRTPLTLIIGYAEMMKDFPNENQAENIQIIIDEANRLKLLVSDLLILSKISSKTENFNMTTYNLTSSILQLVNRQQKLVEQLNFKINFVYDEEIFIEADSSKIEQVMYNFITNAINYSKNSKTIDIIQELNNDEVTIKVVDYGIGIKEDDLKYIWERYYRVDKGHTRSTGGSGLGLSIIKEILDYHHFTYGVESKPNEGSTFWFKAPIKKDNK